MAHILSFWGCLTEFWDRRVLIKSTRVKRALPSSGSVRESAVVRFVLDCACVCVRHHIVSSHLWGSGMTHPQTRLALPSQMKIETQMSARSTHTLSQHKHQLHSLLRRCLKCIKLVEEEEDLWTAGWQRGCSFSRKEQVKVRERETDVSMFGSSKSRMWRWFWPAVL